MHITAYISESWDLMNRGTDSETGFEYCHIRHRDVVGHVSVYRLVNYAGDWRKVGDILPHFKGFRRYPEKRGVKLSNSRMDLTLLSFATTGHGNAYA